MKKHYFTAMLMIVLSPVFSLVLTFACSKKDSGRAWTKAKLKKAKTTGWEAATVDHQPAIIERINERKQQDWYRADPQARPLNP